MVHIRNRYLCLSLFVMGLVLLGVRQPVFAQRDGDVSGCNNGRYIDWFNTGTANALQLTCQFATETDEILILANGFVDTTRSWKENINTTDATWLFDAGADGSINLVIQFSIEGEQVVAKLYDDQDGDGIVYYSKREGRLTVLESSWPTVQLRADGGAWLIDGQVNYNLEATVDGPVTTMASYYRFLDQIAHDGDADFAVRVVDADGDHVPEYDLREDVSDLPEHWGLYRVNLQVNEGDSLNPITNYVLWPHLGSVYGTPHLTSSDALVLEPFEDEFGRRYGLVQDFGPLAPAIQVNWQQSKIEYFAEFVPSRATENGWFVYSHPRFEEGTLYNGDFEYPFGFYDLANDGDGVPELLVRAETNYAFDPYYFDGKLDRPLSMIRYSWQQQESDSWEYTLNLLGYQTTQQELIQLKPDLRLNMIDLNRFPSWVMDQSWDGLTFVHAVNGFESMEGIYMWSSLNEVRDRYFTGVDESIPMEMFSWIEPGFRGEFVFEEDVTPMLYFSPIDSQLHLLNATSGIWNIDGVNQWRYESYGRSTITSWEKYRSGELAEQLLHLPNHLLLANEEGVQLVEAIVSPTFFETQPPQTTAQWNTLNAQLAQFNATTVQSNLAQVLTTFGDEITVLEGATISQIRQEGQGIRLVLDFPTAIPANNILTDEQLNAGRYVALFAEDGVQLEASTGIELSLSVQLSEPQLNQPNPIYVQVENSGLEDGEGLTAVVTLTHESGEVQIIQEPIIVFAEQTEQLMMDWQPSIAGRWAVDVAMVDRDEVVLASTAQSVELNGENGRFFEKRISQNLLLSATITLVLLIITALTLAPQLIPTQFIRRSSS